MTVVCGPTERDPEGKTTVLNPMVIVEVTSLGTEEYDRTEKLASYQLIPSLRAHLVVSHREVRVDSWQRDASGIWLTGTCRKGESLHVEALGCALSVDGFYGNILAGV